MNKTISFNGKPVTCGGIASEVSFDSNSFMKGLRLMFGCYEKERITGIRIEQNSIVAYFEVDKY